MSAADEEKNENNKPEQNDKPKCKFAKFLERNEIFFKTIVSVLLSVAALFVSVASCSNSRSQAQLAAVNAAKDSREKNPFFSIEQYYDKEREQYIYGIVNTGGQIRQCRVLVHPYLVITQYEYQEQHVSSSPLDDPNINQNLNTAYVYLPEFYTAEDPDTFENGVLAFTDIWMDNTVSHNFPQINGKCQEEFQEPELADQYFCHLASSNSIDELSTRMRSSIEYYIEIYYYIDIPINT